jgi:hypothetical protein
MTSDEVMVSTYEQADMGGTGVYCVGCNQRVGTRGQYFRAEHSLTDCLQSLRDEIANLRVRLRDLEQ